MRDMANSGFGLALRVGLAALLSSWLGTASAHELRPAVADVGVTETQVEMVLRLAVEPLIVGMNMSGLADTNDSPLAADHDALRAASPAEVEAALREVWPRLAPDFSFIAGDTVLTPEIGSVTVPEVGDVAVPRDTVLRVVATLPPDGTAVRVGWSAWLGPLVVRQIGEGATYTAYLTDGALSDALPRGGQASEAALTAFARYIVIGFEHIVPKGLDHILFVLGLFFYSARFRPLLWQISSFTLAHTVTLALATLHIVSVPPSVVEPLIAASIVYVAVENLMHRGERSIGAVRIAVVFCFGLLHGLGFASVLGEIGLDPGRLIAGLVAFNVGVELGQLAVIAAAFVAVGIWFRAKPWYRAAIAVPASVVIAGIGAWWVVERTLL
jgi:hypothetical protein